MKTLAERFAAKVDPHGSVPTHRPELGPCHVWTAATRNGYGVIAIDDRLAYANRVAFFLATGAWPIKHALHHCDNPLCVKAIADEHGPAHIYDGSDADNARDREARNRGGQGLRTGARNGSRTHPERRPRGEGHWGCKLKDADIDRVFELRATGLTQEAIGALLGVSGVRVSQILRGDRSTARGKRQIDG